MRARRLFALAGVFLVAASVQAEDYLGREEFLAMAFSGAAPVQKTLWVDATLRQQAEAALGFAPASLRVRYWQADGRTAWILDEIGKERPITFGVIVEAHRLGAVHVMSFRETRGWEVRYPFFTGQFPGAALTADGALDRHIDGITGATLSVNASARAVRLALWLDAQSGRGVATR